MHLQSSTLQHFNPRFNLNKSSCQHIVCSVLDVVPIACSGIPNRILKMKPTNQPASANHIHTNLHKQSTKYIHELSCIYFHKMNNKKGL